MPNHLFNWTFRDVVSFLKDRGFIHHHTRGSHYYYIKSVNGVHIVQVPFHGSEVIKPKTLKGIILQSGISQKDWIGE